MKKGKKMTPVRNLSSQYWKKNQTQCNCASFALNVRGWWKPYNESEIALDAYMRDICIHHSFKALPKRMLKKNVKYMLSCFPELTQVTFEEYKKLPKDVDVIAYRIGFLYHDVSDIEFDFHYKLRVDGQWYEKRGGYPVSKCKLKAGQIWEIPFDDMVYDGPIVYFKKNKDDIQHNFILENFTNSKI